MGGEEVVDSELAADIIRDENKNNKTLNILKIFAKILVILTCLYFFICSIGILSTSFKLLAGETTGEIFKQEWLGNPVVGLMIGILGTVLVQSSSTFSSIIVAAIGGGLSINQAVPMLMGANIGTSVTNTLVAMTQIGNPEEFERAFACATVHDMFNWCAVSILFTFECLFKTQFIEHATGYLAEALVGNGNDTNKKTKMYGLNVITDPFVNSIIQIDKDAIDAWANKDISCEEQLSINTTCRVLYMRTEEDFLFKNLERWNDQQIGGLLLTISLLLLCGSLMSMTKILSSLLKGSVAEGIKRVINPKFKYWILNYAFGYILMLIGTFSTILIQSSSIFTSTLTPMVGIGLIEVETVYPLFLGSNIGTTFTAILAALTESGPKLKHTIQGALVHLFFNVIGILIFYPFPPLRFPLPLCKKLGKLTAQHRWFAVAYIVFMFFVLPLIFVGASFIDQEHGIGIYCTLAYILGFGMGFGAKSSLKIETFTTLFTSSCCRNTSKSKSYQIENYDLTIETNNKEMEIRESSSKNAEKDKC